MFKKRNYLILAMEYSEKEGNAVVICDRVEIGRRLKNVRERSGLSQEQVADFLDVARAYISLIENGKRNLRPSKLLRLTELYGYSAEYFLEVEQPQAKSSNGVAFRMKRRMTSDDLKTIAAIRRIGINNNLLNSLLVEGDE